MLKLFLNRGKGSVTVFVTLIMIPTIFFTAFLGDLARIKMYGSLAVMTADNYAESILTEYDDLLRELYGFFSVSQNEDAKNAIETLMDYSKTSFSPNDNTISYQYLQSVMGTTSYDGFVPYENANIELKYETVENSQLTNDEVFATQMGDFMRFRIAQQLLMSGNMNADGEDLLDIQDKVKEHEADMKAIDAEQKFAEKLQEYLDKLAEYYDYLYLLEDGGEMPFNNKRPGGYPRYKKDYEDCRVEVVKEFNEFISSDEYKEYYEYINYYSKQDPDVFPKIGEALEKKKKGDDLTEEEKHWCEIVENFKDNEQAVSDFNWATGQYLFSNKNKYYKFEDCVDYKIPEDIWVGQGHDKKDAPYINVKNYDSRLSKLNDLSTDITNKANAVYDAKAKLEQVVKEKDENGKEKVSKELRESINKTLNDEKLKVLIEEGQGTIYKDIYNYLKDNTLENYKLKERYKYDLEAFVAADNLIKNAEIEPGWENIENKPEVATQLEEKDTIPYPSFKSVESVPEYKALYDKLAEGFEYNGDTEQKKKDADKKKDKGKEQTEKADKELKNQEEEDKKAAAKVRNIPSSYNFGGDNGGDSSSLKDMMSKVGGLISGGSWGNAGNEALLKVYSIEYDFGMFSSRITEKTKEKEKQGKGKEDGFVEGVVDNATSSSTVSLTGYEKCRSINYLYGAELEYIINGDKSAQRNLNHARNLICGFRMIMNFGSSYSISEVNEAITAIADLFYGIPYVGPAVAIAVEIALRFGFAATETAMEWKSLMDGESVLLYKSKVEELQSLSELKKFFKGEEGSAKLEKASSSKEKKGLSLTYEQYLLIMLMFMTSSEKVFARTRNLIELNTNAVISKVGEDGSLDESYDNLKFKMTDTCTAVKVTCTVQSDFVLIPDGFAKTFLGAQTSDGSSGVTYDELEEFENTVYEYSVIRGY